MQGSSGNHSFGVLLHPQTPETPALLAIPLNDIFSNSKLSIMSFFSWRIYFSGFNTNCLLQSLHLYLCLGWSNTPNLINLVHFSQHNMKHILGNSSLLFSLFFLKNELYYVLLLLINHTEVILCFINYIVSFFPYKLR